MTERDFRNYAVVSDGTDHETETLAVIAFVPDASDASEAESPVDGNVGVDAVEDETVNPPKKASRKRTRAKE